MQSYVYEVSIPVVNSDMILKIIRSKVQQLRMKHSCLSGYKLADIGMKKQATKISITLYFESEKLEQTATTHSILSNS